MGGWVVVTRVVMREDWWYITALGMVVFALVMTVFVGTGIVMTMVTHTHT